jgi:hypothetical protein
MGKAYERFRSLLAQAGIDSTPAGIWLLALFARLYQPYTSPNCAGGHDMNTHVLFMLVMAFDMAKLLGKKLGCRLEHLLAAVILHNLDRVLALKTSREQDPHGSKFRANLEARFNTEMADCPFPVQIVETIREAVIGHSGLYNPNIGSQLWRRLQELDMLSRINVLNPTHGAAHWQSGAAWSNGHVVDLEAPWLCQMPEADWWDRHHHKHSAISAQFGLNINWLTMVPEEVLPLIDPFMPGYLAYLRATAVPVTYLTGDQDLAEKSLLLALGWRLYDRYCR